MNKERLLRIADKLVGAGPYVEVGPVPPEKFDMTQWCGKAACAVGHACVDPWFNERGLKLGDGPGIWPSPKYKGCSGFNATSRFFDISFEEATYLFTEHSTPHKQSAADVAARIYRFIAEASP